MIQKLRQQTGIIVLADQALVSGGSFLLTIILARLASPSDFGTFAGLTMAIYLIISILNALSIQPLQVLHPRQNNADALLSFGFWWFSGAVTLLALVLWVADYWLHFSQILPAETALAAVLYGITLVFNDYFRKSMLVLGWVGRTFWFDCISVASVVVGMGVLYRISGFSLQNILTSLFCAYLPAIALGIWWIQPRFNEKKHWPSYARLFWDQGKWLLLTAGVQWWSGNLFFVASGVYLGAEALGAFRLIQSIFGVLNIILQSFENHTLPLITRIYTESATAASHQLRRISGKNALLFGVLLVFIFVFADAILYGAGNGKYAGYGHIVRAMTVLYAIIFMGYPVRLAIRMRMLNQHFFTGYLLSLGVGMVLFPLLLAHWQLAGAVAGLIISQIVVLTYWNYTLHKNAFSLWK